ncbi:MAG TPA: transglutaminase-like domain-containing protein [bacterium]
MRRALVKMALLDALLLAAWGASVGLVLLHERGPWLLRSAPALSTLRATMDVREQWFGIYYQGAKLGFAHTLIAPHERNGIPGISIRDQGELVFNLLGEPQRMSIQAWAFIDADWRLAEFEAGVVSDEQRVAWHGVRDGDVIRLTIETPSGKAASELRDPQGRTFVTGMSSWAVFHELAVGQQGTFLVLNPLALRPEPVMFSVPRSELVDGRTALIVETTMGSMTSTSWVTQDGEVLRETSPLGWELVQEPMEKAMTGLSGASPALDLLSATSVPVTPDLGDPARVARAVVLMRGVRESQITVERAGQRRLPPERLAAYGREAPEGPWVLLELSGQDPVPSAEPETGPPSGYLAPSPFVQADDPRVIALAREAVGDRTGPWEQALALYAYVWRTLKKQYTIGIPTALDVMATNTGDCHEHTVLYTALARSRGIATRMMAGLVYQHGRFYYHAWPEVWMGRWVPLDPTLGQAPADLTHIGLIEAEAQELAALGQFVGRVSLEVLETEAK